MAESERMFVGVLLGTVVAAVGVALAGIHFGLWPGPDATWPGVVFASDRPSYALGESVTFSVRNVGREHIHLSCSAPWVISRNVGGTWRPVESHGCYEIWITLEPERSMGWSWDGATNPSEDLAPVVPGLYRISLPIVVHGPASSEDHQTMVVTASFRLV